MYYVKFPFYGRRDRPRLVASLSASFVGCVLLKSRSEGQSKNNNYEFVIRQVESDDRKLQGSPRGVGMDTFSNYFKIEPSL